MAEWLISASLAYPHTKTSETRNHSCMVLGLTEIREQKIKDIERSC